MKKKRVKSLEEKFYKSKKGRSWRFRKNLITSSLSEHISNLPKEEAEVVENQMERLDKINQQFMLYVYEKGIKHGLKQSNKM